MNGDPKKSEIAAAQNYFATKTRVRELDESREKIEKRLTAREEYTKYDKILSSTVLNHGVDRNGLAKIKSNGDSVLFGGHDTRQMKKKYGLNDKQNLPDHLPSVVLAAKRLADEITAHNTETHNLYGLAPIDSQHQISNRRVRKTLTDSGIKPGTLPPEEDIKKVKKRLNSNRQKGLTNETL
jgi:DNA-damage-inducible protein D